MDIVAASPSTCVRLALGPFGSVGSLLCVYVCVCVCGVGGGGGGGAGVWMRGNGRNYVDRWGVEYNFNVYGVVYPCTYMSAA